MTPHEEAVCSNIFEMINQTEDPGFFRRELEDFIRIDPEKIWAALAESNAEYVKKNHLCRNCYSKNIEQITVHERRPDCHGSEAYEDVVVGYRCRNCGYREEE